MIAKETLYNTVLKLNLTDTISHEELKKSLVQMGYKRVDLIENRGEFSIRGDIVDIGLSDNEGVRFEFFGEMTLTQLENLKSLHKDPQIC